MQGLGDPSRTLEWNSRKISEECFRGLSGNFPAISSRKSQPYWGCRWSAGRGWFSKISSCGLCGFRGSLGDGPNAVSESTVSNTELSQFFGLTELRAKNSMSSSQPIALTLQPVLFRKKKQGKPPPPTKKQGFFSSRNPENPWKRKEKRPPKARQIGKQQKTNRKRKKQKKKTRIGGSGYLCVQANSPSYFFRSHRVCCRTQ